MFQISGLDLAKHSCKQTILNVCCNGLQWNYSRLDMSQSMRYPIRISSGKRRNCCQELIPVKKLLREVPELAVVNVVAFILP